MKVFFKIIVSFVFVILLSGFDQNGSEKGTVLEVYKNPVCNCCGQWVSHLVSTGFDAEIQNRGSLDSIKRKFNIPADLQSCHTSVSKDGYFFEGHIPTRFIRQFLSRPPVGAVGLAVAGMPVGSPGMEIGDIFSPYSILLVMGDGSTKVYAEVATLQEQYR